MPSVPGIMPSVPGDGYAGASLPQVPEGRTEARRVRRPLRIGSCGPRKPIELPMLLTHCRPGRSRRRCLPLHRHQGERARHQP
ncbi:hypothetical protein QJS04_geneDACA012398 [Acorus gramineus]|uniref:Uncharacterized protein n=1 Tax=Acorus gramineus TaxID=55184 RepID=A0AAV9BBV2_ACOGR|nr:hypothetical protein QJS04_geneDACA012398 [Acorus gramineus]